VLQAPALLDFDRAKKIVLGVLNSQLSRQRGRCAGFVVMPNHVHAIVWFPADDQISEFVKEWKKRSSVQIKRLLRTGIASYGRTINADEPVWQAGFYDFNVYSPKKLREKLEYMHNNPVAKGLVAEASDWPWSSARHTSTVDRWPSLCRGLIEQPLAASQPGQRVVPATRRHVEHHTMGKVADSLVP
jgi:putative transposase